MYSVQTGERFDEPLLCPSFEASLTHKLIYIQCILQLNKLLVQLQCNLLAYNVLPEDPVTIGGILCITFVNLLLLFMSLLSYVSLKKVIIFLLE